MKFQIFFENWNEESNSNLLEIISCFSKSEVLDLGKNLQFELRGKRRLNMNSEQSDVDYRFTLIINRTSERSKNLASDSECESLNYA